MSATPDPPASSTLDGQAAVDSIAETSAAVPETPKKLSKRLVVSVALGQFGNTVPAVGSVLVSWPTVLLTLAPQGKEFYLALISGLAAVVGVVTVPVAGVLSDRCMSRFGMRKPFIAVGAALMLVAAFVMGTAGSVDALIVGALVQAVAAGIFTGGYMAIVPDQIPETYRGRVMGISMMMTALAGLGAAVVLPMFLENQFIVFVGPGVFMAATSLVMLMTFRDRRLGRDELTAQPTLRGLLQQFKIRPRDIPDYSWAWLGKAFVTMGSVFTTTYGVYYLTDHLRVSPADLPGTISISGVIGLLTAIVGALAGSWISDRLRIRKKMVLWTASLLFVGAMLAAVAPSVPVYLVALFIMGLATGAYFPIDGAVMIDVMPGEGRESGKYMALMGVADHLPRSVGPFAAAAVLSLGSYTALGGYPIVYITGGLIAVAGGLLIRKVKGSI